MKPIIKQNLRISLATSASALAMLIAGPAFAQSAAVDDQGIEEIVVTAQRQAESLQDVPIAVTAFSAETLERQQIENSSDLQLTLPNVTFTKGNFTGSSFTIRGVGDLCVGVTCDSATAIHVNDTPLLGTRLFETEYFDLERVEVLRGPQGTLFGRNATSGVVNFVTAKPRMDAFSVQAEGEYGNFNSMKVKGAVNIPLGETFAARVAGFYLKRDGFTENVFNGDDLDGRDMYAVRGSLRWQPSDTTTVDLMAYYFREDDNRLRIQKQLCQRDPTGILGCLPGRLENGVTNGNASFVGTLGSREFLSANGIPAPTLFGLGSLYGPDPYATAVNPASKRQVNTDHTPTYFTDEQQYQLRIEQDLGDQYKLQLTGFYHEARVDSSQDYNLSVQNRASYATALATLAGAAAGGIPGLPAAYFTPIAQAIIPGGPAGQLCTSAAEETGTGSFGGYKVCSATPQDFDRSNQKNKDWSVEAIFSSDYDGAFNFLLGGIYADADLSENSYYVNSFGIDYVTGLLGTFTALGSAQPPSYLGTPFFRNNTDDFGLKSYGIFGEAYYEFNDRVKFTAGLRYNNDKKTVVARSTLASFLVPFTATNAFDSPRAGGFDADPATACAGAGSNVAGGIGTRAGCEAFQVRKSSFDEFTGRAVLDFKLSDDSLLYASYSRGYKSGGINPPLQPIFAVPDTFAPEFIDAFEVGSKNTFLDGTLRLNATAFYYKYKDLQLSRIVARTSVNDNVDADIYGLEIESILNPSPEWLFNINFSYLHTKVAADKFLSNPRDPSGGRSDAVIIKDITNGANCAVIPNTAGAGSANTFVNTVNTLLNNSTLTTFPTPRTAANPQTAPLQGTTAFPANSGLTARGAFSSCAVLQATAATVGAAVGGVTVLPAGVEVNLRGNALPQAPNYKVSAGAQYTIDFGNGMTLVPRADLTFTGDSYGSIFNGSINRINSYTQVNAQVQLNGPDDKWFVRGFVQNLTDNSATTGLYVTDQSSGLYTNIFTLDPRRYGIAAGVRF
ncbi:TonB-dependent receptor [Sphingoaurantiacus capsulatus]|uniref:TonB-dependent receptor n=1 Tax=Sphingoaurantiacus capsulatus TaxID=1771310 RepID=A0ABV7XE95_9SPHN